MYAFWALATLMAIVALAFVLVPLLRARALRGPSSNEVALEVLRGQRREIEGDIATGTLPAEAREEALAELVERAHRDLDPGAPATPAPAAAGRPWPVAATLAVLVPALAFGLYSTLGTPSASDPGTLQAPHAAAGDAQILEMVESLARKVRERPEDTQGWSLLARSMAALGRFPEAAQAYEHLSTLARDDPSVLADWADALGMAQGRSLKGRPQELALAALKLDPKHKKALALAATAALDAGDFAGAIGYWQRLAAELPPGSEDAAQVASIPGRSARSRRGCGQAGRWRRGHRGRTCRASSGRGQLGHRFGRARPVRRRESERHRDPVHLRARRGRLAHAAGARTSAGEGDADDICAGRQPGDGARREPLLRAGGSDRGTRLSLGQRHAAGRRPRGHQRRGQARRARREDRGRQGPAVTLEARGLALLARTGDPLSRRVVSRRARRVGRRARLERQRQDHAAALRGGFHAPGCGAR
jgi:cytochrome c-type biogenesis protein CcmH